VLQFLERWLLFRPVHHSRHWEEAPPALNAHDIWLTLDRGVRIHAWWCPPADWTPAHGAVLYCQGYKGNLSLRAEGVRRWQERLGRGVLIFDYPGYGKSTGKPGEAGCYAAAGAACDWLLREGVAPEEIVLAGGSLGGGVATELATHRPYRALVLIAAFTSVPDMAARKYPWLPGRRFIRNRFDNLAKIGRTRGRVFLAHGTADHFVPFAMGEALYAAAPGPKRLFPMAGYDHYHTPGPEFYAGVSHFLAETAAVPRN
jgi:fermentation-respiration switch protein FrsA (DUF1100 family)